jgi:acetyl esterase/lipase
LGESPSPEVVRGLSNETQVSKETPAVFLAHTNEDKGVPPENSLLFAMACRKAGVPLELHVFEKGGHGLGLGTGSREFGIAPERGFSAWPKLCEQWMRGRGILDVEALAGAAP